MGARFHDLPLLHKYDPVGELGNSDPVRDEHNTFAAKIFADIAELLSRLHRQLEAQELSYQDTLHSFMDIKRIIHDMNKQLVYIRTCIEAGHAAKGADHINGILHQIVASCNTITTGNLAVDALVSHALHHASCLDIAMQHKVQLTGAPVNIERYDLCILLGNLLDNAIDAARQVRPAENRSIQLHIHANNNALVIYIGNSMAAPASTAAPCRRAHPELHGIGLSTIQQVTGKYGGHLRTTVKPGKYETVVVLPYAKTGS
ncbi:ATP-binding protein [Paenibacillus sp. FSL R7-0337]|uniref:ATP-binding protein n=1 Tax=Paenibacillus sp. FSL R7-0337 TaxID=1926588 RepID=UPI00096CD221|nr:ATP-binding protein [Paenibacillus sp. FSL R7-0337]OMF89518.1 hypothetical protein BK147_25315 [Paenibacillus sp. FSL R7-0337]